MKSYIGESEWRRGGGGEGRGGKEGGGEGREGKEGDGRGGKGKRRGGGWEGRGREEKDILCSGDLHNTFVQGDLLHCLCLVL